MDGSQADSSAAGLEERLQRSVAHLAESQRVARLGSGELDVGNGACEWSEETYRILGLEPGAIEPGADALLRFVHPADRATIDERWKRHVEDTDQAPHWGSIFRILRPDGVERLVDSQALILRRPDGTPYRLIWTLQDITERAQLEERLRVAERLESLGLLSGGVAHDFNNLLTLIGGNVELLRDELGAPHARTLLEEIDRATQRAAGLVRQMLDFAGQRSLDVRPLDLSEVMREGALLVRAFAPASVRVEWELASDLPAVAGDRVSLEQMLYNLVSNAVQALGAGGGEIRVRTGSEFCDAPSLARCDLVEAAQPGTYVFLEVKDAGQGIDAHTRRRIFEPFFSTRAEGRGLGLSAVHGLVRQHRGAISVTSEPGRGSCFRILLPALTEIASDERAEATVREPRSDAVRRLPVLVVDDEAPVRALIERQLARAGFPVIAACDAAGALDALRADASIGCVLFDLTMPGMPPAEALRSLRALRPGLPVVLMSGYARESVADELRQQAPDGFLGKPFLRTALLGAIEAVLTGT